MLSLAKTSTIIITVILLTSICILRIAPIQTIEYIAFDFRYRLLPKTQPPNDIVIIDIDDASISEYGRFPWPRKLMASLINKIVACKPKNISIDILFANKSANGFIKDSQDKVLVDAIANAKKKCPITIIYNLINVDFPSENLPLRNLAQYHFITNKTIEAKLPALKLPFFSGAFGALPEFAGNATSQGFSMISPDEDGVVRQYLFAAKFNNQYCMPFVLATLNSLLPESILTVSQEGMLMSQAGQTKFLFQMNGYVFIKFPMDNLRCTRISAANVLQDKILPFDLANKNVILGTGESKMPRYMTPTGLYLDGLEIQASALDGLLNHTIPIATPDWEPGAVVVLTLFMSLLASLTLFSRKTTHKLSIFLIIFTAYSTLNVYWFVHNRILINLSAPLLAFMANAILLNLLIRRKSSD